MLASQTVQNTAFEQAVIDGLLQKQKTLPCQWLYDQRGSELFEDITRLPEYYPTRTETWILKTNAADISARLGPNPVLIEYGAGASVKTRILLDHIDDLTAYIPIDVSSDFLLETADAVRKDYPGLDVHPVVADFLDDIPLPALPDDATKTGFFPGSTIGNLSDLEIRHFLIRARKLLGTSGQFILGYDLRKSPDILIPAYDDSQGVTAAFNLNLLVRANNELGATFDVTQFQHEARWNDAFSRIEMHLVSQCAQTATVGGQSFHFRAGETIHTENSRKFSQTAMQEACASAGWTTTHFYTDADNLFALALLSGA